MTTTPVDGARHGAPEGLHGPSMTTLLARDPEVETWPLTRAQYDLLIEAGELEGRPVELLDGVLVRVPPQGENHSYTIERLTDELVVRLREMPGRRLRLRPQLPIAASDLSEPEPDVAVVDADRQRGSGLPTTAHPVIEVSMTRRRVVVVRTLPSQDGYAQVTEVAFEAELDVVGSPVRVIDLIS
jgi:hypothetical protein